MNTITLAAAKLYVAMDNDVIGAKPQMPPGMGSLGTIVSWLLWIAGVALFALFISGIVKAARARHTQGQVDAEAPMWPLVWAVVLGAAGTIWRVIVPA